MEKQIARYLEKDLSAKLKPNRVLIILGPRRSGKTVLVQRFVTTLNEPYLLLNGEDAHTLSLLRERSVENYKRLLGNNKLLIIDEAQHIPDIGMNLKLMVDEIPGLKVMATGSSSFDLRNQLGEPLTGRETTLHIFPLSQMELSPGENLVQTTGRLEMRMIYGGYPELEQFESDPQKADYLRGLVNDYLLKDILEFENIRNASKLYDLLRLIAFQIGQEVSLQELGSQLGMSKNTVERYLDLFSKVFVIYRLQGFSRNLRKEITKSSRWYFYDNGIRNTLIANLNPLSLRNDTGALWENYVLGERIKYQSYKGMLVNNYFWRTYQQQEIDWVEDRGGKLYATELKWKEPQKAKAPSAWQSAYPESEFQCVHPRNYLDWVGGR